DARAPCGCRTRESPRHARPARYFPGRETQPSWRQNLAHSSGYDVSDIAFTRQRKLSHQLRWRLFWGRERESGKAAVSDSSESIREQTGYSQIAGDTPATTGVQLMHRKRLTIGKFPGDARSRANESCSAPRRRCK